MKISFSEKAMVLKYCEALEQESKIFAVEVPFFHRSIDVVFVDRKNRYYAIEFKLKNWKRALEQAKDYMIGAEFTFICIPKHVFNENVDHMIDMIGCGLIIYDEVTEKFAVKKKPAQNRKCSGGFLMEKGFKYAHENHNYKQLLLLES